ncbi:disease resistance protein [Striga asiatica]|uniref:Disease resistance protein n=1 Tax=Striga asiatica TaxID=4170 RepID=A0A5A7QXI9_STRAF|nr:disease resistance protein [Striga asiatica]
MWMRIWLRSFFDGGDSSMMQILELSYKHLPGYLKPCFLYFAAFPEDAEIPAQKLTMLWIAEGYVKEGENKSAEVVAEEYLIELIGKSLVMVAKRRYDGGCKACVIHDLLHDLCLRKAGEENLLKLMDENCSIYERHHRLCFNVSKAQIEIFRPFFIPHVCSFFSLHLKTKPNLLSVKLLRALDLQDSECDQGAVRFLLHLRYLSANETPPSISQLVNLEYLIVKTSRIVDIHPTILKMMKLRHLQLAPLAIFDENCVSSLTNNLQYLSNVSISNLKEENVLRCSPDLIKLKCRCQPFTDEQGKLRYPDLEFLTRLESLKMTALRGYKNADINFPSNIKKLTLDGLRLPWQKVSVIGGLVNLEVLKLMYYAFVGKTWETRDGEFEQLRFLKLEILDFCEWIVETSEHFPSLEQLVIRDCNNLREIPGEIGEIMILASIEVESCLESLAVSAKKIEQEQRDNNGNEEFRVMIGHVLKSG